MDLFRFNEWNFWRRVNSSIIETNGVDHYVSIKDKYFEYDADIYKDIHSLKEKYTELNISKPLVKKSGT